MNKFFKIILASFIFNYAYNRILPSIGVGLEYFVMPNLRLRTQFKYSHLISNSENDNNSSSFELNGYSNLNFGTAYYF